MHVAIELPQPGMTVVRPQGPLDMHSVPAFHQILEAEVQRAERGLIVALADITCMDSAGLAVLIVGLKWSRGRALPYVLTHVPPAVQRVLELARLEHFFPIASSVEEAARQCQRPVHTAPPRPAAAGGEIAQRIRHAQRDARHLCGVHVGRAAPSYVSMSKPYAARPGTGGRTSGLPRALTQQRRSLIKLVSVRDGKSMAPSSTGHGLLSRENDRILLRK